jgi:iron complex transport system ATP-binding protein
MSIHVNHVSFAYGHLKVLYNVTALAHAGKITALIGPNASGKSTLLRCIIGSLRPNSGSITLGGSAVRDFTPRQLARKIAYMPQRSIVSAAFTVRQVVELGRYALGPDQGKVDWAMQRLDLADIADRPYPRLSVGQQQRVTLARAMAQLYPEGHLILDEPTSAMDLRHISSSLKLLRQTAHAGATIIIALHDLSLAAAIADEVWLMDNGSMTACGNAREVLDIQRLHRVFGVPFQWVSDGAERMLVADVAPSASHPG